jgi:hypothetical protein
MVAILVVIGFVVLFLITGGLALIFGAFRRRKSPEDPALPVAQLVHGERSPLREPGTKRRAIGNAVRVVIGTAMVGVGSAIVYGLYDIYKNGLFGPGESKGRILRLRGKAQLPERALGGGWSDGTRPRTDHLDDNERAVLAEAWHLTARMEHASIAAFAQLGLCLTALGAPSELVESTHRAALDETRHARRAFALAGAYGGQSWTAGPIPALAHADRRDFDLVRLAIGSLVDGCVAEGIAADVAANGARGAEDPVVRDSLAMIAADEARHAELGWSVLVWCLEIGGAPVRDAVAARAAQLDAELAPRAPDYPGIAKQDLARHGLWDQDTLGTLARRRIEEVRTRASALTAPALAA